MVIAIDGPAASGKGTLARRLAAHYGLPHLDTGLLYRAVGIAVLRAGGDPSNEEEAWHACGFDDALLADPGLKSEAAGRSASIVSAHPAVRAQRRYDELIRMKLAVTLDHVLADIQTRDERDSARSAAPLRMADDAVLIDTSDMGVEEAIAAAVAAVAASC